jgi:hypothetical protein
MSHYKKISRNFQTYDRFLSSLSAREKEIALSLKMMYAIHMEGNKEWGFGFGIKQVARFFFKLLTIPFVRNVLKSNASRHPNIILADTATEQLVSEKLPVSQVKIGMQLRPNQKAWRIYKELFHLIGIYRKTSNLNKRYIMLLLHRVIDYLLVYHTIELKETEVICIENDRNPKNLALIHQAKVQCIRTIKYDNWLIDPVHHNDIYCDTYFYPSIYHKNIIEQFDTNAALRYLEGGFVSWDILDTYTYDPSIDKDTVIYFTQFGIELSRHKCYIEDILMVLDRREKPYMLIIKVHPRENSTVYQAIVQQYPFVRVVKQCDDVYELISSATYCFSIFSTVSLEAKHIMDHSYFINYDYHDFSLVDYDKIGLDLVKNREMIEDIFNGTAIPVDKTRFIRHNNCSYPHTLMKLEEILNHAVS